MSLRVHVKTHRIPIVDNFRCYFCTFDTIQNRVDYARIVGLIFMANILLSTVFPYVSFIGGKRMYITTDVHPGGGGEGESGKHEILVPSGNNKLCIVYGFSD